MSAYHAETPLAPSAIAVGTRVSVPDWRRGTVIGWSNGTVTIVRGPHASDPDDVSGEVTYKVRLDSTGEEALYYPYSMGAPEPEFGRYTVLMHDGLSGGSPMPEPPSRTNTTDTLSGARRMFADWLHASGNDYTRAEGYGEAFADVVPTRNWDGISYGDITGGDGVERLTRGPRGGVVRTNF